MLLEKRFLLQRYSLMHTSFVHTFNNEELEKTAKFAQIRKFRTNEEVYKVGDKADAVFIVSHGVFQASHARDGVMVRIGVRGRDRDRVRMRVFRFRVRGSAISRHLPRHSP